MNRKPFTTIRQIAATICMFALMAVALPAAASDQPLPVPEPANGTRDLIIIIPLTPEPLIPVNNQEFSANGSLKWTNVSASSYVLKFRNLRTGEVISKAVPGICSEFCWASEGSIGLRTTFRDGDAFTWQVVAKMGPGYKVKSGKAAAIFNEVDKATLLSPANNSETDPLGSFSFTWSDSPLAKEYTLIVRDAETGVIAFQTSGERLEWCGQVCSYAPVFEERATLQNGRLYKWQVKTLGMTNEKAKSAVSTFTWKKLG